MANVHVAPLYLNNVFSMQNSPLICEWIVPLAAHVEDPEPFLFKQKCFCWGGVICQHACGDQRATCGSWFSPSTMWPKWLNSGLRLVASATELSYSPFQRPLLGLLPWNLKISTVFYKLQGKIEGRGAIASPSIRILVCHGYSSNKSWWLGSSASTPCAQSIRSEMGFS